MNENGITPKEVKELQKSFCKIQFDNNEGTGFFMKFECRNKGIINCLVTCCHVLSNSIGYLKSKKLIIDIEYIAKKVEINLTENNRIIEYFDKPIDLIIVEILYLDFDNITNDINFLEYDLINSYKDLIGNYIYIFHHPLGEESKW